MLRVHPRHFIVQQANSDFKMALIDVIKKYNLTPSEVVKICTLSATDWNRDNIRAERHPLHPECKGDLLCGYPDCDCIIAG